MKTTNVNSANPSRNDPEVAARLEAVLAEKAANGLILDSEAAETPAPAEHSNEMITTFGTELLHDLSAESVAELAATLHSMPESYKRAINALPTFEEDGNTVFTLKGVDQSTAPLPPLYTRMSEQEFWRSRGWLRFVQEKADDRSASAYGALVNVLTRVCSEIPARYVLPPVIQSVAALNFFSMLVGNSGASKSGGAKLTDELYDWELLNSGLTSGEGLQTTFAIPSKGTDENGQTHWVAERVAEKAYICVDEVSTLTAQIARSGSTAGPFLRSFWSGAFVPINKSGEKVTLPNNTFRLALTVGGQPDKLADLLIDDGSGMAERFFLLRPVSQQRAPWGQAIDFGDADVYREWFKATRDESRKVFRHRMLPDAPLDGPVVPFEYEPVISDAVKWHAFLRGAYKESRNAVASRSAGRVAGHGHLLMLQIATLFAVIEGRTKVSYEDYALANHLMALSREHRAEVMAEVSASREAHAKATARLDVVKATAFNDGMDSIERKRAADSIIRALQRRGGEMTVREARLAVRSDIRPKHADGAMDGLVETGKVRFDERENPQGRGEGVRWVVLVA